MYPQQCVYLKSNILNLDLKYKETLVFNETNLVLIEDNTKLLNINYLIYVAPEKINIDETIQKCFITPNIIISNNTQTMFEKYKLVYCLIDIFNHDDNTNNPHAMTGYFCDGVPKIFDSNGYIYTTNWLEVLNANKKTVEGKLLFDTFKKNISLKEYKSIACVGLYINDKFLKVLPSFEILFKEIETLLYPKLLQNRISSVSRVSSRTLNRARTSSGTRVSSGTLNRARTSSGTRVSSGTLNRARTSSGTRVSSGTLTKTNRKTS